MRGLEVSLHKWWIVIQGRDTGNTVTSRERREIDGLLKKIFFKQICFSKKYFFKKNFFEKKIFLKKIFFWKKFFLKKFFFQKKFFFYTNFFFHPNYLYYPKKFTFTKNVKFTQKPKGFGRRGDLFPCCYDFEWSEITARGDRRPPVPLLLWFRMKWNNSKGRLKTKSFTVMISS